MKVYIKPSIKQNVLLVEGNLLEDSIIQGKIDPDNPGEGIPEDPVIFEAPRSKSVWDD